MWEGRVMAKSGLFWVITGRCKVFTHLVVAILRVVVGGYACFLHQVNIINKTRPSQDVYIAAQLAYCLLYSLFHLWGASFILLVQMKVLLCLLLVWSIGAQPTFSDNCNNFNLTSGTCQGCVDGFFLQYFFCLPCAPLCLCSSQESYCDSCMVVDDYVNSLTAVSVRYGDRCHFCDAFIPNCLECITNSTCSECYGGYYLVNLTSEGNGVEMGCSSVMCTANCELCSSSTECKQCQAGYFLESGAKNCSSSTCQDNCSECESATTCKTCSEGYFLISDGSCTTCNQSNCEECSSATECGTCQAGYYPQNGTCVSSGQSNCVIYEGPVASNSGCMFCEAGYFMLGGSCNPCVGCVLCSLQFLCQSPCQANTTAFNYACVTPNTQSQRHLSVVAGMAILLLAVWLC